MRAQTMQRARVNGVELEYDVTGQGEPVLLISPVLADGFLPLLSEPSLARRYRPAFTHETAVELIRQGSGEHFDPDVVDAMLAVEEKFKAIALQFNGRGDGAAD